LYPWGLWEPGGRAGQGRGAGREPAALWGSGLGEPSSGSVVVFSTTVHPCQISTDKAELPSRGDGSRVGTEQLTLLRREAVVACHG